MNVLRLSLLVIMIAAFAACGDDDDGGPDCAQSDWVGTYTGILNCDGFSEDATMTITASGSSDVVVVYTTTTLEAEFDPMPISGCSINQTDTDGTFTLLVEASLNGNSISFKDVITVGGEDAVCNFAGTK